MEKKRGRNREAVRRLWGFLGALWLVTACLAGCGGAGSDVGSRAGGDRAVQVTASEAAGTEGSDGAAAEATEDGKIQGGGTAVEEPEAAETDGAEAEESEEAEINKAEAGGSEAAGADKAETEEPEGSGAEAGKPETGGSQSGGEAARDSRQSAGEEAPGKDGPAGAPEIIEESGTYTSKDQVALYLHTYGQLPENYITKRDAEDLGWDSKKGNLWEVAPGMSIGGSRFGNYEGALPDKKGRKYFECDIDYEGGYRGAKRLIYSDDGLIFYTEDHYNTFEQLYGE